MIIYSILLISIVHSHSNLHRCHSIGSNSTRLLQRTITKYRRTVSSRVKVSRLSHLFRSRTRSGEIIPSRPWRDDARVLSYDASCRPWNLYGSTSFGVPHGHLRYARREDNLIISWGSDQQWQLHHCIRVYIYIYPRGSVDFCLGVLIFFLSFFWEILRLNFFLDKFELS